MADTHTHTHTHTLPKHRKTVPPKKKILKTVWLGKSSKLHNPSPCLPLAQTPDQHATVSG